MAADQVFGYPWDGGSPLSAIGDDSGLELTERRPHHLLRPVYINAVEVGFAYHQVDRDRRLHVRGVTIALWYFISKGHQVIALLPHCFKIYTEKSSNWTELMHLFRMNLIEFTPGFGSEKYIEVNRILATRARETGGCVVARSQMHAILDEIPQLDKTIEKRLLMPAFNGDDLIFPMDGPLGRNGPTLNSTLCCDPADIEWGRCSHHQLTLHDQRTWVQRLTAVVSSKSTWTALATKLNNFEPSTAINLKNLPIRPSTSLHLKVRPPESNPPDGRGFSHERRAMRRNEQDLYYLPSSGGDQQMSPHMAPSSRTLDDLFLPEYAQDSLSLEKSASTPSDENSPTNGYGGGFGNFQQNGYMNGGFRTYQNNNCGNHYGRYNNPSSAYNTMIRRRFVGQPYWQQRGFPGVGNHPNGQNNGYMNNCNSFNRYRFNEDCGTCQNCRHSCLNNRVQPIYERRYDQRSDRFYERLGAVDESPISQDPRFRPIRHNDLFEENNVCGMGSTNHNENNGGSQANRAPSFEILPTSSTENKEVFNQVAAILGWEKAKMITERYPHVNSVQMLIEYAFEDPDTPPDLVLSSATQVFESGIAPIQQDLQANTDENNNVEIPSSNSINEGQQIEIESHQEEASLNAPDESTRDIVDNSPQQSNQINTVEGVKPLNGGQVDVGWQKFRQRAERKSSALIVPSRRRLRATQALPALPRAENTETEALRTAEQSPPSKSVHTAIQLDIEELPLIDLSFTGQDEETIESPVSMSNIPDELANANF
ncbi:unnamed protein product, partial [Mesorhabditis belari]|uniref:RNase NYN domain-containing protein n=1 Tax=Mesorhabditis belari TaxID=2138241 RepID=A0AAF3F526_9BILA